MTATRGMLVSSFLSALIFFAVYYFSLFTLHFSLHNHGLWLAQVIYLAMRGIIQTIWYRLRLINTI
jgi:MATE family multidrug resistance protein